MPWIIEWSMTQEANAHKAGGTPRVFEAKSRDEALLFAEEQINNGRIIWCLKDEAGTAVMDRKAVWDFVHSAQRPSRTAPARAPTPAQAQTQQGAVAPAEQRSSSKRKSSPLKQVLRLFRKRR